MERNLDLIQSIHEFKNNIKGEMFMTNKMTVVEQEIALTNSTAMIPSTGRGLEDANMEDVTFPRTKIMQPTSPELSDHEGLRMGDIVDTLMFEKVPKHFTPIKVWDSNVLFTPRAEKMADRELLKRIGFTDDDYQAGNILCRANEGKFGDKLGSCMSCGLCNFKNRLGEKPLCNSTINVLGLFDGYDLPIIIQFSVTSYKHGKNFKQMLKFSGGDIFKKKYELFTEKKQGEGKTWFEIKVKAAGMCKPDEFAKAEALWQMTQSTTAYMEQGAAEHEVYEPKETTDDDMPF